MRPFSTLRYEKRGAIAIVTLDRPAKLNAYNVAMRDDLYEALGAADEDPDVRALVLRGRGRAFSTGGDVSEFGTAPSPLVARFVRWQRDVWGRLLDLRAATIAAVHGYAVGGGMEMALCCDFCLAADDARFALPETGLGMIPGVAPASRCRARSRPRADGSGTRRRGGARRGDRAARRSTGAARHGRTGARPPAGSSGARPGRGCATCGACGTRPGARGRPRPRTTARRRNSPPYLSGGARPR